MTTTDQRSISFGTGRDRHEISQFEAAVGFALPAARVIFHRLGPSDAGLAP